ncbi:MAG: glycosyltransferase family 4 protein [Candidatus Kapabacteria bacterium]|nr:glycosyltransferase family 4 protein [Candidatus Kapabacteria bacterium]MDW8012302.1 glycosyltransferase family 4 protein [Bacteroidota bacterium]
MRIAVVCGHFMPEVGYQEVWIARTLVRKGIAVRVVTSTAVSSSARRLRRRPYPVGRICEDGYELVRLPVAFRFRSAVLSRGVVSAVVEWRPDAILLLGVGKLFGVPILTAAELRQVPIACFFSELHEYRRRHSLSARVVSWLQDRGFELVKRPFYRRAIRRAELLVCNMPATLEWLQQCCANREELELLEAKARVLALGYDPQLFFFSALERQQTREQLGVRPEEVLILTVTRVVPRKGLERIIAAVGKMQRVGLPVRYVLVGGLGDGYQRELLEQIQRQPIPEHFAVYPFLPPEQTRRLAAAADLGVWMQPAISANESLGVGLPLVLPRRASLLHLLQEGRTGWYWEEPHGFEETLATAVQTIAPLSEAQRCQWRQAAADENAARFSYDAILEQVLVALGVRERGVSQRDGKAA